MKPSYLIFSLVLFSRLVYALPENFVYLKNVDPSILQEMRYAGEHNFVGRQIKGYETDACILTRQSADALARIQQELKKISLSLKVYDCYRPTMAVADFMSWSEDANHQEMKQEFYPHINKADVFRLGYVADQSSHSRGSTVDITIVPLPVTTSVEYKKGQTLISCTAPYAYRFHDNSLDMGTGYDCLDEKSWPWRVEMNSRAWQNRMVLRSLMMKHGFQPYEKEWWHFTLSHEPYPNTYFNFMVR